MPRSMVVVSLAADVAVLVYATLAPIALDRLIGLQPTVRGLVSGAMLLPLGFLMGMPAPMVVRLVNEEGQQWNIPWLWGVNGTFSMLGSVAAIAIAITFGLTQAMVLGVLCYLAVTLLFLPRGGKREYERNR